MGQTSSRKYPYPNPTGDGADVSYWVQRLAAAIDLDVVAILASIASVVSSATSSLDKITALTTRATNVEGRATALEKRAPFIIHAGQDTVTVLAGKAGASINVKFAAPFTKVPIVTATMSANTAKTSSKLIVHIYNETPTGFTIDLQTNDNSAVAVTYALPISWQAIQMTSTSAEG